MPISTPSPFLSASVGDPVNLEWNYGGGTVDRYIYGWDVFVHANDDGTRPGYDFGTIALTDIGIEGGTDVLEWPVHESDFNGATYASMGDPPPRLGPLSTRSIRKITPGGTALGKLDIVFHEPGKKYVSINVQLSNINVTSLEVLPLMIRIDVA